MYDWKRTLLKSNDTLEKAIQILDQEALRIVLVVDQKQQLEGTVTDGDIRRALIKHRAMDTPLSEVMHRAPITASIDESPEALQLLLRQKHILQVPLLDRDGQIAGLEMRSHLIHSKRMESPVFLMAGGFGKRLRPLTADIPKPLLHVGNRPILETILGQFIESGFSSFYISTHYKAEMIQDHFGDGSRWGISITYIHEDEPLGTAGAVGMLPNDLPNVPIIVMNGDLLTKVNFQQLLSFHEEQGGVATMCVREYDFQVPFGVIESEGHRVTRVTEKPTHRIFVNAGIYVLNREFVEYVSGSEYLDMPSLFEEQIERGKRINMFPVHEYWLDIGHMGDFELAQSDYYNIFQTK